MLSKSKIKLIQSLDDKKKRLAEGLFVAEGNKMVGELLQTLSCRMLLHTSDFDVSHFQADEVITVSTDELRKVSFVKTPQQVLGVFRLPTWQIDTVCWDKQLTLMLDGIQDPGNLGTIIRLADWYGIENIICSPDTADAFNPKVVQATMGALARVKVYYTNLAQWLDAHSQLPVYGTFLDGENIYNQQLTANGVIVMGNEGNGIRSEVANRISRRLYLPTFPLQRSGCESLNVSVATAIVCAEFRRRQLV